MQHSREFMSKTAREQFLNIITRNAIIKAPTSFIYRDTFFQLGCFDENYPMAEDCPLWIKATKSGFVLRSINVPTVKQRIHDHSVWNQFLNSSETVVNTQYIRDLSGLIRNVYLPELFANRFFLNYFSLRFELAAFGSDKVLKKKLLNDISQVFKLINRIRNKILKAIHN
jgi:hypothetical protein